MPGIGDVLIITILICIIWHHFEWQKTTNKKIGKIIIIVSVLLFVFIFIKHYRDCRHIEEKYKNNMDQWVKDNINNYPVNVRNRAFLLLREILSHPFIVTPPPNLSQL